MSEQHRGLYSPRDSQYGSGSQRQAQRTPSSSPATQPYGTPQNKPFHQRMPANSRQSSSQSFSSQSPHPSVSPAPSWKPSPSSALLQRPSAPPIISLEPTTTLPSELFVGFFFCVVDLGRVTKYMPYSHLPKHISFACSSPTPWQSTFNSWVDLSLNHQCTPPNLSWPIHFPTFGLFFIFSNPQLQKCAVEGKTLKSEMMLVIEQITQAR